MIEKLSGNINVKKGKRRIEQTDSMEMADFEPGTFHFEVVNIAAEP